MVAGEGSPVHLLMILSPLVQTNGSQYGKTSTNEKTMLHSCCINSPFLQKPVRKTYASRNIWHYSHTQSSKACNMDGMTTKMFILLAENACLTYKALTTRQITEYIYKPGSRELLQKGMPRLHLGTPLTSAEYDTSTHQTRVLKGFALSNTVVRRATIQ